jgi:hypothetical protein
LGAKVGIGALGALGAYGVYKYATRKKGKKATIRKKYKKQPVMGGARNNPTKKTHQSHGKQSTRKGRRTLKSSRE